jgi:hypothetical protein
MQEIYDYGDNTPEVPNVQMIECKVGNYIKRTPGSKRISKMTAKELKEAQAEDNASSELCLCQICTARRINGAYIASTFS